MNVLTRMIAKRFYDWLYGWEAWGEISTNNYGYAPLAGAGGREGYQLQLYAELGKLLPREEWLGRSILEVGCGRGGGLLHLARELAPRAATGLDSSKNAVRYGRMAAAARGLAARFEAGDARALPFPAGSFDVVLSVESSHVYPDQRCFLREVRRVLASGGRFLIADYRPRAEMERFRGDGAAAGLALVAERDITGNVLDSCVADSERREELIRNVPKLLRNYMREYSMIAGSKAFLEFGERFQYFLMRFNAAAGALT
jgi:SAM-dependent methyltransferase